MQTSMGHACHVERHFWKSRQDEMKVLFTSPTITWRTCNNARIYLTMLFFLALQRGYEFPQPTARVLIGTPCHFYLNVLNRWTHHRHHHHHHRHHACTRRRRCVATLSPISKPLWKLNFWRVQFPSYNFLIKKNVPLWMEWTSKHQGITSQTSVNFVYRSSVNKVEQDLPECETKEQCDWRNKPGSTEGTQSSTAARCQQTPLSLSAGKPN